MFLSNVGTVARSESDFSHGDIRLADSSRWPSITVSSRDSVLPNVPDCGGGQKGQRILRCGVDGETSTLPTPLRKVIFLKICL